MVGEQEDSQTWVEAAMTDESLVAETLMQLSRAETVVAPPLLKWGLRLPRSRQITTRGVRQMKQEENRRASPTTPLSFSGGGTSPSGGDGDGVCVESSRSGRSPGSGDGSSKIVANEASTSRSTIRRTKRKKTIAELKEEANFLIVEKIDLNKEIEALTSTCKVLREEREKLKKLKLSLERRLNPSSSTQQADSKASSPTFVLPDLNLPLEEV